MIVRCPICTKDAPAGGFHTCTPTETWRQTMIQMDDLKAKLEVAKAALEASRPVLSFHEYEPWRNEMDKQTGHAASAVRHALDRLNQ